MGDRLRHVGSAVPRTSGLAEPYNKSRDTPTVMYYELRTHHVRYVSLIR